MIKIGKPYIKRFEESTRLYAPIDISEDTALKYAELTKPIKNCSFLTAVDYPPAAWNKKDSGLYFSVSNEYEEYLSTDSSNAFVVAMLWYAMITCSDISFETPISKMLYDGLTNRLIPALSKDGPTIRLSGPVNPEPVYNTGGVVTGLSCGVDSLYALNCYDNDNAPDGKRLTHLTYYVADYLFPFVTPPYDVDKLIEEHERAYNDHVIQNAGIIAEHHNLPLIVVRTNLDRDYYRGGLIYTAMYRFLSCTLALEHLFSLYLIASSGNGKNIYNTSLFAPTQHYEDLLCDCCRTENLYYRVSDHEIRINKIRAIADDNDVAQYLSVCFNDAADGINCGECFGCWKTMIPLDILGKLSRFSTCFDLDKYYNNRKKVMEDLILFSARPEAEAARESVRQILELSKEIHNEASSDFLEVYEKTSKKLEQQ